MSNDKKSIILQHSSKTDVTLINCVFEILRGTADKVDLSKIFKLLYLNHIKKTTTLAGE